MNRKQWIWALSLVLVLVLSAVLLRHPDRVGPSLSERISIRKDLWQAVGLLKGTADIDQREQKLIDAGFSVLDSTQGYPTYLAGTDGLISFWEKASRGENSSTSLLRVLETGNLRNLLFVHSQRTTWLYVTDARQDGTILETTTLPVYDMELCDWGIFYYRCYPEGDPHYVDYSQIRMAPADRDGYDLLKRHILPAGYQMVNLFLTDWQEGDWGSLSISDTLEYLYRIQTGTDLPWETWPGTTSCIWVPAKVFEETVLAFFAVSQQELRSLCSYDDAYPWKPIHGNDLTGWKYPMCVPEVVAWTENPDKTLTLNVRVRSPEIKAECLFAHELTIRPTEHGFQYVANRITEVSQSGLPPAMARFQLKDNGRPARS